MPARSAERRPPGSTEVCLQDQHAPASGRRFRLRARVVERLRDDEHGGRSLLGSAARFIVTGVLSVVTDVSTLAILHSLVGWQLTGSTVVAYFAGLVVNYSLNRTWTFKSSGSHRATLLRYAAMVAFNFGATLGIVLGLTAAGLFYLLAKLVAVAINASINFLAGRHWVFAAES